jgi:hypothetical protein
MNRRSFFNTMLGTAPVAAATLAMTPPSPPRGIEFLNPQCPTCLAVFDVTAQFPYASNPTVADRCSPRAVECRCGWSGELIFYRRQ